MGTKNIQIKLDFRSGIPIYVQIMDQIRQMVASGELQQGDQLPTVRQLATELRINWNTVSRAYKLLDDAELISTQQGRGTYVWEAPTAEITSLLRQQALEGLVQQFLSEINRLGCSPDEVEQAVKIQLSAWKAGAVPLTGDANSQE